MAQQEVAQAELGKPFPQEAELTEKSSRLAELDAELNMDEAGTPKQEACEEKPDGRSSVLAELKARSEHITPDRKNECREEVL